MDDKAGSPIEKEMFVSFSTGVQYRRRLSFPSSIHIPYKQLGVGRERSAMESKKNKMKYKIKYRS
jgi:hypothetical protein